MNNTVLSFFQSKWDMSLDEVVSTFLGQWNFVGRVDQQVKNVSFLRSSIMILL